MDILNNWYWLMHIEQPPGKEIIPGPYLTRDSSSVESKKIYFHFLLSIQYVKFL
jgi:hypothetical protein